MNVAAAGTSIWPLSNIATMSLSTAFRVRPGPVNVGGTAFFLRGELDFQPSLRSESQGPRHGSALTRARNSTPEEGT